MLEEMLSRVAASPAVHLDHIIRYFSGMMYNPRVVPSHYKPMPAASHTQNIINIDSFLISHTTQDKDLRLMHSLPPIKLKTKRIFKLIFKQFLNLQYV